MKEYIKLAWRNIWRNKRRTLITAASIFFAVFFALIMRSFQLGSYDAMIKNAIASYSGFIQIQGLDYLDEPFIDNSIPYDADFENEILADKNVNLVVPRFQAFGLASNGDNSKFAAVVGIDIEKENIVNKIEDKIVKYRLTANAINILENEKNIPPEIIEKIKKYEDFSYSNIDRFLLDVPLSKTEQEQYLDIIKEVTAIEGKYFTENTNGVLVADKLAKYLNLNIGDSIIIMSQGYHGVSAAGIYPIQGFLKFPSPEFDNTMIYMPLKNSQNLFSAYEISDDSMDTTFYVSYLSLNVENNNDRAVSLTAERINGKIDNTIYKALDWKEFNKELVQQIDSDNISGQIMLALLYLIIGFGVFGTVLMMTKERQREFGVMVAVGMQKRRLEIIVILEMIIVGFLGTVFGFIASIPIILAGYFYPIRLTGEMATMMEEFNMEPIMPMAWFDTYMINQIVVVLIIVLLASLYPVLRIGKLKVINALRA